MSEWYRKELELLEEFKKTQRNKTKYSLGGITLFFAVCIIGMIVHGNNDPTYNTGASIGIVGGMLVFILLIILLSLKLSKKRIGLPKLEEKLNQLLTTPEMIEEFDAEMLSEPLWKAKTNDDLRITKHYLVNIFGPMAQKCYTFVRLEDIAYTERCVSRDNTKLLGLGKVYDNDICAVDGRKIAGITIQGKKNEDEFEEQLEKYVPNIRLRA